MSSRRVTITDVAAAAGVSRQTVTRAMNGMTQIAPSTRARVLAVARELRYRPSRSGRDLVRGQRRTVGLVVHSLINPYYPELASAVVAAAARRGWNVVLSDTRLRHQSEDLLAELAGQVDVVVGYVTDDQYREGTNAVPVVTISDEPGIADATVRLDIASAMADLAEHWVGAGVRNPVFVGPGDSGGRVGAFTSAMAAHGVDVRRYRLNGVDGSALSDGSKAARALMADGAANDANRAPVDAVLAFNDIVACGLLKGFRAIGVDVPGQVRVAGIDGLSLGTVVSPELTTLHMDLEQVAEQAVSLALAAFDHDLDQHGSIRSVKFQLVVRESA